MESDIPLDAARATPCTADRLPGSLAKLLPLLPPDHRRLIQECARGRVRLKRGVTGYDLVAAIEAPADSSASVATIREFFDGRAVDVAQGSGCSDEPYPVSFDWAIVLDAEAHVLYSFILNCRD